MGKGTAGHADHTGIRQPEGQETQVFHKALLQGQRLHAEVPFDEQIKAKRLLCDAKTHPGDAFLGTITVFSANERIQDYILAIALCCSDNYCSDL